MILCGVLSTVVVFVRRNEDRNAGITYITLLLHSWNILSGRKLVFFQGKPDLQTLQSHLESYLRRDGSCSYNITLSKAVGHNPFGHTFLLRLWLNMWNLEKGGLADEDFACESTDLLLWDGYFHVLSKTGVSRLHSSFLGIYKHMEVVAKGGNNPSSRPSQQQHLSPFRMYT